jgi:protein-S-isoprenylcysteine O-methyltransferase Ste14
MAALDCVALVVLAVWPSFGPYWLGLHGLRRFWKRFGWPALIVLWALLALLVALDLWLVFTHRAALLSLRIVPGLASIAGWIMLAFWLLLDYWTKSSLGAARVLGICELLPPARAERGRPLVTSGVYSFVRHPRYASVALLFLGLFLITGLWVLAALFACLGGWLAVVIPMEEKELTERYGEAYLSYRRRVPALLPRLFRPP